MLGACPDLTVSADVIFAVDSIPAVFGVTLDPFIIYTSNIFAVLSLRALYRFVSNVMTGRGAMESHWAA
jgi:predicted tellurium resistance membrane protein TerC